MKDKAVAKKEKKLFDTKGKKITFITVVVAVLLLIAVVMFIEIKQKSQLIINNKTDLNLEYVKTKYVYSEGDITDYITTEKIAANDSYSMDTEPFQLYNLKANYEIVFKFEGQEELYVDAGVFDGSFNGAMKIAFKKTDDPNILKMTVKADSGLFVSRFVRCNEEYTVDLTKKVVFD